MANNIGGFGVSGGNTSPEVFGQYMRAMYPEGAVISGLAATQASPTPNMTVTIQPGVVLLTKNTISSVAAVVTANESVPITTANTSNPRIDSIVIYEDTVVTAALVPSDSKNERFKLVAVPGTPSASPVAPTSGQITTAIGSGKPYEVLYNITVPTSAPNIVDANISNVRNLIKINKSTVKYQYSTSEQLTGDFWINGKPIYKKTVSFGTLPNNTTKSVAHGISSIGNVISMGGTSWGSGSTTLPIPNAPGSGSISFSISMNVDSTNIVINTGADRTAYTNTYITVEYTKST